MAAGYRLERPVPIRPGSRADMRVPRHGAGDDGTRDATLLLVLAEVAVECVALTRGVEGLFH